MRRTFITHAIALATSVFAAGLHAATFPENSVKIIVPFTAGTGPDVLTRAVGQELAKLWNQPVVVLNRPGSNGVLAIEAFKNAPADGHTLILMDSSILTINPHLYSKINYNPTTDFQPLAPLVNTPFNLMVTSDLPVQSLAELVAYSKAHPGKLSYGSNSGVGHPGHLGMEEFMKRTGADLTFVPYPSSQPMLADMATGRLQVAWSSYATARAFIQNKKVRVLATGTRKRQADLPDVPTIEEAGGPAGFVVNSWLALYGAPALTAPAAQKLAGDVTRVMNTPAMSAKVKDMAYEGLPGTGADMENWLRNDSRRFGALIKELKIKLD